MTFEEYKKKKLKDPDTQKAYEELGPEYELIRAIIDARCEKKITQKELAQLTGIDQSYISRLESGNYNPSLKFLKRLAMGLGKELSITFEEPKKCSAPKNHSLHI